MTVGEMSLERNVMWELQHTAGVVPGGIRLHRHTAPHLLQVSNLPLAYTSTKLSLPLYRLSPSPLLSVSRGGESQCSAHSLLLPSSTPQLQIRSKWVSSSTYYKVWGEHRSKGVEVVRDSYSLLLSCGYVV